jgi:hypothetical protein
MKGHQSEWQIVFIISAIVYLIGAVFNFWLLDAEIQPWAKILDKDHESTTTKKHLESDDQINNQLQILQLPIFHLKRDRIGSSALSQNSSKW